MKKQKVTYLLFETVRGTNILNLLQQITKKEIKFDKIVQNERKNLFRDYFSSTRIISLVKPLARQ
jgi:uncharacterized protein Yka (UPF0111/DUF47 family)